MSPARAGSRPTASAAAPRTRGPKGRFSAASPIEIAGPSPVALALFAELRATAEVFAEATPTLTLTDSLHAILKFNDWLLEGYEVGPE